MTLGLPRSGEIGVVGYGEVGAAVVHELVAANHSVRIFDGRSDAPLEELAGRSGVRAYGSADRFGAGVNTVVVAVPGRAAKSVSQQLTDILPEGTLYADLCTKSVASRDEIGAKVRRAGLAFADVAIVDPLSRPGTKVSLLASGEGADSLADLFAGTRFGVTVLSATALISTEAKLCRTVFAKGLSALLLETMTVASHFGLDDFAIGTVADCLAIPYERLQETLIGGALKHASRRADEMDAAMELVQRAIDTAPLTDATRLVLRRLASVPEAGRDVPTWREAVKCVSNSEVFR